MTQPTFFQGSARADTRREALLVLCSVTLLSSLAAADRATAWLIGQFPTYVPFWRIRFEFLRPIGVYYDMVERSFGGLSPADFSVVAFGSAALIGAGVVSRIRLARALSCHLTFGAAAVLAYLSWDTGVAMRPHAEVGMTSQPYAIAGMVLAALTAGLCLRIHAEYFGWNPASSRAFRRARVAMLRLRSNLVPSVADLIDQPNLLPGRERTSLVTARAARYRNRDR
jgi:hypothetical protein